jgi:hypothetical protein
LDRKSFDPAELHVLLSALRQACMDVGPVDNRMKSVIANRILSMACDGERDFETLRIRATAGLDIAEQGSETIRDRFKVAGGQLNFELLWREAYND